MEMEHKCLEGGTVLYLCRSWEVSLPLALPHFLPILDPTPFQCLSQFHFSSNSFLTNHLTLFLLLISESVLFYFQCPFSYISFRSSFMSRYHMLFWDCLCKGAPGGQNTFHKELFRTVKILNNWRFFFTWY